MMEQHQREIQELRFAHIKELQDTELRTMRRSNQQLEQLRIELADTHEKMLAKEKDILTARWTTMSRIVGCKYIYVSIFYLGCISNITSRPHRYKEKLKEQEAHFQTQQNTLAEHFEREKSMLIAEQKRRDKETSAMIQQMQLNFQVYFMKKKLILLQLIKKPQKNGLP